MAELDTTRPLCSEVSAAAGESQGATASRVEHWLLVEYGGHWPYDPLDAAVFAGRLRDRVAEQLAELPRSRLLLIKRPGRQRREAIEVIYGSTPERGRRFWPLEIAHHADLRELDLAGALLGRARPPGERLDHPLLLVCTHGTRDRCCAKYGQVLCRALHRHAPDAWVWQASHVGGDRFAGNVVALPEGVYYGRVRPGDVPRVLAGYLEGRIDVDVYRGRSCYPMPVQAAELEVRRRTGLFGFDDLRLAGRSRDGDGWRVGFVAEVTGDLHEVSVQAREWDDDAYLTCRAPAPKRPRHFVVAGALQPTVADV
jgi:hypothetical protein